MKVRTTRARHALGMALGLAFGFAITSPVGVAALSMLPVISILTPTPNQTVTGVVSFYVAADSSGVESLQFKVDGKNFGTSITSGSCRSNWDTTQTNDGLHTIEAVAQDQYGNTVISQPVTVLVSNSNSSGPAPTPTPTPAPNPGVASVSLVSPAPYQTIAGAFEAVVQMGGPVSTESVSLSVRTPAGVTVMTVEQFQARAGGRAERSVNMSTLVNGDYDLVAGSTVGPTSSSAVRVVLTGGLASGPTPTPTPGPAPAPGLPPSPTPTPTPTPTPEPTPPGDGSRTAPTSGTTKGKPKSRMLTVQGSDTNSAVDPNSASTDPTTPQVQSANGVAVLRTGSAGSSTSTAKSTAQSTGGTSSAPSRSSTTSGTTVVVQGPIPGGCTEPDPFRKIGGVGLCVNGEWLALWRPKKK